MSSRGLPPSTVGTVAFAGGSFGALWVMTGENQTDPVQRATDISDIDGDPSLTPEPATSNFLWDHSRNILFAFPCL